MASKVLVSENLQEVMRMAKQEMYKEKIERFLKHYKVFKKIKAIKL